MNLEFTTTHVYRRFGEVTVFMVTLPLVTIPLSIDTCTHWVPLVDSWIGTVAFFVKVTLQVEIWGGRCLKIVCT